MRLLLLIGAQAVGKMTVGEALCRITPLRLYHNHMSIEPVISLLGRYDGETVDAVREAMFRGFLRTENYGLVFTYVWDFDAPEDWAYVRRLAELFGGRVDCVELVAPLETRLARNRTEHRLAEKPSKRNVDFSEMLLMSAENGRRCVSREGEVPFRYLRLDNTTLTPEAAAERIAGHFGYERTDKGCES